MDKHYSDEDLLSSLDGEISKRRRRRINQHLEFCWSCRTRQAELEKQIQTVSSLLQKLPVHSDWHRSARENIALFQSQFEAELNTNKDSRLFRPKIWIPVAAAASCAIVLTFLLLRTPHVPVVTPSTVLDRTEVAAAEMAREPIHQIFEVKEIQIQPAGPTRKSHLEIWSDGQSNRFASKWTADGRLKHAIWSTGGNSFVYASNALRPFASGRQTRQKISFIGTNPDFQNLDAQFISWLENRPWKPIVLLADKSLWQGDGVVLQVQRLSARRLQLTVRRNRAGIAMELVALVDSDNPVPNIQTLRLQKAGQIVEIELSSEKTEMEPAFVPAVFYPDRTVIPSKANPPLTEGLPHPEPPVTNRSELSVSQEEINRIARTVNAHYILHLAGACKGTPVTVSEEDGGVRISSATASGNQAIYFTKDSSLEDIMNALAETRNQMKNGHVDEVRGKDGAELAANAIAVRILASDFDASKVNAMPAQSATLLRRMFRDHMAVIHRVITELQARSSVTSTDKSQKDQTTARPSDWREAASLLSEFTIGPEAGNSTVSGLHLARLSAVSNDLNQLFEQEMDTARRLARTHASSRQSR